MNSKLDNLDYLKDYFESLPLHDKNTREFGRKLIDLLYKLKAENSYLKDTIKKTYEDIDWLEKKANEWMLKALENSQSKE